jgi:hypothetical protein
MEGKPLSETLITGAVAIIVCIINNWVQMSRTAKANDKTVALIEYRINELSEKVQRHNNIIERTYKLEENTALQDAELKRLNKRLEIVEDKTHE